MNQSLSSSLEEMKKASDTGQPMLEKSTRKMEPQKFMMWFAIGSITLTFAGFTSAYIVRKAQGLWEQFTMPSIFYYSTVIILLSSLIFILGKRAFKAKDFKKYNLAMLVTLLLGITFMVLQYMGFKLLYSENVRINGNVSNSFFFVIAGAHLLHILGGVIALTISWLRNYIRPEAKRTLLSVEIMGTYWHFIDILWLYLFVFLVFNN